LNFHIQKNFFASLFLKGPDHLDPTKTLISKEAKEWPEVQSLTDSKKFKLSKIGCENSGEKCLYLDLETGQV